MYNSIYPIQIKPYVPPQTKKAVKNKDEQESSSSSSDLNKESRGLNQVNNTDPNGRNSYGYQEFPNGQKSTIDYTKSQVNIAQIITDFKNTALAIGSPPNIIQEVNQYLALAETQSLKSEPNKKIIQSNLKNASNVLDEFISKTLNKESKVVENWIDALFLQQVNYKSDPNTINEDFLVKLPDNNGEMKPISQKFASQQVEPIQETADNVSTQAIEVDSTVEKQTSQKTVYIPQNENVRKAFIQGKKYAAINNPDKALESFNSTLSLAQMIGDKNAEGMACFEIARIYDSENNIEDALKFYNKALLSTDDNNLKVQAYYSMGQIYDDVVCFEPAVEHYFAAISFAGESENLVAQSKALCEIGDMYAEKYDVFKTHEFYGVAKNIALETKDNKVMGVIWAKSGDSMYRINENLNALQDYKASAQFFEKAESPLKMAKNFEKASDIMTKLGNRAKSKSLLEKAVDLAIQSQDVDYANKLSKRLHMFEKNTL